MMMRAISSSVYARRKHAAAEIDAGDQIAVGAMTSRASTLVSARAVLDVERRCVLCERATSQPGASMSNSVRR